MSDFLTKEELTILSKGLDLYESDPIRSGMFGSLIGAVLARGTRSPEEAEAECKADIKRAEAEADARKLAVARLRVKLMEMAQRPSEFSQ